jgi:hypothetical protein
MNKKGVTNTYKFGRRGEKPGDPQALLSSRDTFNFDGSKRKLKEKLILQYATTPLNSFPWSSVKLALLNNASFLELIVALIANA